MWILDLETDGLMDTVTKIHCAVLYDTDEDKYITFRPNEIDPNLFQHLNTCEQLSCHNGLGFDLKVLKKLYNYEYKGIYRDTLLMSRILWPDIEGGHSVDAWGQRFGIEKPKHEDWSKFSEEMLYRCIEDTKIQAKLYQHIIEYTENQVYLDNRIDFDKVFRLEHKVWEIMEQQHDYGWQMDLEHAYNTKDIIENAYNDLEKQLIKSLPIRVVRPNDTVTKAFKADGELTATVKKWVAGPSLQEKCTDYRNDFLELSCWSAEVVGDFCKVTFHKTNPGSPDQIKEYLLSQGWQPLNWNYQKDKYKKVIRDKHNNPIKTSPKMPKNEEWDIVAELADNPKIKLVAEFYVLRHRKGLINSFIEHCNIETNRIHYDVITCGTNTARMQHKIVVNVPRVE